MLQLRQISKRFGDFTALNAMDFSVGAGEIVALLGENGAGKSTAISLIGGENLPDGGEIWWHGARAVWKNPREAAQHGIGVVHQHFSLVPALSIAENLALSGGKGAIFRASEWENRAVEWAQSLNWPLDPRLSVGDLSVGQQQRVEILKALFGGAKTQLLLLDEPTANLTPREASELFETLRELKTRGLGIVFVSHKLREVMALCDRATVLRRGKVAGERQISQTDVADLAQLMVGREMNLESDAFAAPNSRGQVLLEFENVAAGRLHDVNFEVRAGEIIALVGVDGNGQRELFEVLAKLRDFHGVIRRKSEIAFVPPDRRTEGLILGFDITENFVLGADFRAQSQNGPFLNWNLARQKTRQVMEKFDIRAPQSGENTRAAKLSGGNAQKIVLARALESRARIIVALDPTRGLDIGAASFVHQKLREAAQNGRAILLISTDLDEVLALGDRFGAFFEGKILPSSGLQIAATRAEIGKWMGGDD